MVGEFNSGHSHLEKNYKVTEGKEEIVFLLIVISNASNFLYIPRDKKRKFNSYSVLIQFSVYTDMKRF